MRAYLVSIALLGSACRPTPAVETAPRTLVDADTPPSIATRVPTTEIAWPPNTFALALPDMAAAPWSMPPFEPGRRHPLENMRLAATSGSIAIAVSDKLHVGTSTTTGIVGALRMPARGGWIEIVADDVILVADSEGQLWRAATLEIAVQRGFERVGRVAGAKHWDASGHFVVARAEDGAWVSSDGGTTFQPASSAGPGTIETIVVRDDGVVVVQVQKKDAFTVMISSDAGHTWSRSQWHPFAIYRQGGWIIGDDSGGKRPKVGLLASDGKSWAANADVWSAVSDNELGWRLDFENAPASLPDGRVRAAPAALVAPPPPARSLRGKPFRWEGGEGIGEASGTGGFGIGGSVQCRGLSCLHAGAGDEPLPVAIDAFGFADTRCVSATTPCPFADRRSPHFALFDHRDQAFDLVQLPTACIGIDVVAAGGLTLIGCGTPDGDVVYGVDSTGTVARESITADADAPWSLRMLSMAADGTIVVPQEGACERWAKAWVRRPLAVGAADAWRLVEAEHARTWRAVGAGIAMAVIDHGDRGAALHLDHPDGEREVVLGHVRVGIGPTDVSIVDGRVVFWAGREGSAVLNDGSAAKVSIKPIERVVDGVTIARAEPWIDCAPP